ncbi:MAG: 16S rRNA (cytosine(1402)-N(4))-methyltransferase RsmH [Propionibacteriaceae bacterium]|nr:16S rRNA (cytosine(1402)-N(4))-methyltransferase RsmH [Propionibacteriaceae bacterium]
MAKSFQGLEMATSYTHIPVMCQEIMDILAPALSADHPVMVDATLGLGGHSSVALARFPSLRVIGIDRDPQALEIASKNLHEYSARVDLHLATFDQISEVLQGETVDAVLFDLGLSSLQIDSPDRGFSYAQDAPLAMRMDGDTGELSAADVVNTYPGDQLESLLRHNGDEKYARRITQAILLEREKQPFTSSARLVETITSAMPAMNTRHGHPAKRTFQAIRMEVNQERPSLESALPQALDSVKPHGFIAVLSYHSGEDRLVKKAFNHACMDQVPHKLPLVPKEHRAQFVAVTRGALKPTEQETKDNRRAGSARLRVIKRIEVSDERS